MDSEKEQVATPETMEAQTVENQETQQDNKQEVISKEEYAKLQKELDNEKSRNKGLDKKVQELLSLPKSNVPDELMQKLAYLDQKIELLAENKGGYGESSDLEGKLKALKAEETKTIQELQRKQAIDQAYNRVKSEIEEELTDAGIGLDSAEAVDILSKFNSARAKGDDPTPLVKEAKKAGREKLKSAIPDINKLKEQWKAELLEEQKKSTSMKVDTGSPIPSAGSTVDIRAKYSRGEIDTTEYIKRMKEKGVNI